MRSNTTAFTAKTISVNGTPIAGSAAAYGPYITFDQLDASTAVYLNGTLVQGTSVAGQILTNYDHVNVLSGVSLAAIVKYGVASTPATNAATGPISGIAGGTPTPTPTPTLNTLTVSNTAGTVGTALSSTISGLTAGSSVALTGAGAAGLSISGAVINGTPTTAGAVNIVETLAGATNSPNATAGAVTIAAAMLAAWKNALALAKAGTAPATINSIGDSVTAGDWAGTPGNVWANNARAGSYPAQLQGLFESNGFSYGGTSFIGGGGVTTAYTGYNSEITTLGTFTAPTGNPTVSLGGIIFRDTASATALRFQPVGDVDTFRVFYPTNTTLGSFAVGADGTTIETVAQNTAAGFATKQYTVTAGQHFLALQRATGGAYIVGAEARNSANKKSVLVRNMGWGGSSTVDWTSSSSPTAAFGPIDALPAMKADLHIIKLGINDWQNGVSIATFQANLRTIIAAAKTQGGSVMLVAPNRTDTALTPAATQQAYVDAIQQVASQDGYTFFDVASLPNFSSYATANAAGLMGDQRHPLKAGYTAEAQALYGLLNS